uniref:Xylulose kinase-1 n=1 Tax=Tanacetum cinerariifolium TaxID=118510 RepID=A0A699HGU1_TANCI|nr:hypothetical protein [Tanacetum cinerariifolium]
MVAYLTKSDASKGFNQVIDFLNGSYIKYALTVDPNIYVSCIKQFWNTVTIKQDNDVTRMQALVDKKKVVVTEAAIRDVLRLDDAEGVDYLPNKEIFAEVARMGYEKPSTKLTFYKAFFSSQWKFLIHNILQLMSAKRTSWNEFSSIMDKRLKKEEMKKSMLKKSLLVMLLKEIMLKNHTYHLLLYLLNHHNHLKISHQHPRRVEHLEYDKVAQALEISKLKRRVKKLKKGNRVKGKIIDEMDKDDAIALMDDKEEDKKDEEAKVDESAQAKEDEPDEVQETKEQMEEEESRALQRINETPTERAAKKRKLNEEVEDLKIHLEIVPNKDDNVYTKATPLARKERIHDYVQISVSVLVPRQIASSGWPFVFVVLGQMTHLVASMTLDSASISPEGFLPFILLLAIIIVAVAIVVTAVLLVVDAIIKALQVTDTVCRLFLVGASFTQGTILSIPIGGSISLEGFLLPILLLVVIIVTVVIVAVILVVVVVVIFGVVIVVTIIGKLLESKTSRDGHGDNGMSDSIGGLVSLGTKSSGGVIDLTGDEDPTDEDGDTRMDDLIGILASLGGEISSRGKKSQESNSDNTGGTTVGEAIGACSGGIGNSLLASYVA